MSELNESIFLNKLEISIKNIINEFNGLCGVSIFDLNSNWYFGHNDDLIFPTASSIKIPVLIKLIDDSYNNKFNLSDEITVSDEMKSRGSGIIHKMQGPISLTIENLAILMINLSDNTATNLCIDFAKLNEINQMLVDYEFSNMRLNRKMQDYEAINAGKENISTPKEMNRIMQMLYSSNAINKKVSNKVLEILSINKSTPISQLLPEDTKVAGKTGGMPGVRCETAIIYLNNKKYVLTVMTSFAGQNESSNSVLTGGCNGSDIISKISYETYKFFNILDTSSKYGQGLTQTINY